MTTSASSYICLGIGLSCALVGGVFQAFSDFVMRGLMAARPAAGVEVMQMINLTVFQSVFLVMLLALVPVTLGFSVYAWLNMTGSARVWVLSGCALYFIGVFLVTVIGNVPMNERLKDLDYAGREAAQYWQVYGKYWTCWNHLRTLASVFSAVAFLVAALLLA